VYLALSYSNATIIAAIALIIILNLPAKIINMMVATASRQERFSAYFAL
jgi:hypothetical protein